MAVHQVPAGTMLFNQQLADQLKSSTAFSPDRVDADAPKPFVFDPIDALNSIKSEGFRKNLINSLIMSADSLIVAQLRTVLGSIRTDAEEAGEHLWDTYQQYLAHIAGLEAEHEWFTAAGAKHANVPKDIQLLADLRGECYRILNGDRINVEVPTIEHVITHPRMRGADANTLTKMEMSVEDEAMSHEDREELLAAHKAKDAQQRKLRYDQDKRQVGSLLSLWRAFNIRDDRHEAAYDGEFVPYKQMSSIMQLKILRGMINAVSSALDRGERDFTVTTSEYGKWRLEARPYRKLLQEAAAHDRFDDDRDAVFG